MLPLRDLIRREVACTTSFAYRPDEFEAAFAAMLTFGIYMVGDSRINIAGLPVDGLDALARAIAATEPATAPS